MDYNYCTIGRLLHQLRIYAQTDDLAKECLLYYMEYYPAIINGDPRKEEFAKTYLIDTIRYIKNRKNLS
mgnify:CR=1 FL=1